MRKLLIVVGPLAEESFLAVHASEDRTGPVENGSRPSVGTQSLSTESERTGSPRDDRSCGRGERNR
jgi:hypothetical protein